MTEPIQLSFPKYVIDERGKGSKADLLHALDLINAYLSLCGAPHGDELGAFSVIYRIAHVAGAIPQSEPQP